MRDMLCLTCGTKARFWVPAQAKVEIRCASFFEIHGLQ